MNEKNERSELNDAGLKGVSGGSALDEIISAYEDSTQYQTECWQKHNFEYDAARCAACTKVGNMSKAICRDMLSKEK